MAMEAVSPDIPLPSMSPRISFSHDFIQSEPIPVEQRRPHSRSSFDFDFDFDFCILERPDLESSSADQIFSHGQILPLQINHRSDEPRLRPSSSSSSSNPSPPSTPPKSKPRFKKDPSPKPEDKQASNSKSFWHFKRSTSCGSAYTRSLCPLPLLSRSNSTGSAPSTKRAPLSKDCVPQKQSSLRNASKNSQMGYHKPPLKKLHGSYGHGIPLNPVLNLHSGNLFGLASIFSSPKDRTKKK